MTNYIALGEYTEYNNRARKAAGRRYALMCSLAHLLAHQAERPGDMLQMYVIELLLAGITEADNEMRAAIDRANQSASLCSKPAITPDTFFHF